MQVAPRLMASSRRRCGTRAPRSRYARVLFARARDFISSSFTSYLIAIRLQCIKQFYIVFKFAPKLPFKLHKLNVASGCCSLPLQTLFQDTLLRNPSCPTMVGSRKSKLLTVAFGDSLQVETYVLDLEMFAFISHSLYNSSTYGDSPKRHNILLSSVTVCPCYLFSRQLSSFVKFLFLLDVKLLPDHLFSSASQTRLGAL